MELPTSPGMAATKKSLLLVSILMLVLGVLTPTLSASGKAGGSEPPASPDDLRLVSATRTELKLEWSRLKDEKVEEYEIYVSELRNDVLVDSLHGKTKRPTYTIGELECGTSYRLAVAAVDRDGNRSELTRVTTATKECAVEATPPQSAPTSPAPSGDGKPGTTSGSDAPAPAQPPSAPTSPAPSGDGKPGTTSGSDAPAPTQPSAPPTGQPSQQTDTAVPSDEVAQADKAPGDNGSGTKSEAQRGTVDGTAPTTPANLRVASATSAQLGLAWDRSRDNGKVVGYDVYLGDVMKGTASRPGYTLGNLVCGTSYAASVVAKDKAGNRSAPARATGATSACADANPPSAPTDFRSEFATTTSAVLVWNSSTDNVGVTSYGIYDAGVRILETPEPKQAFTGLTCGTTYYYFVDAADAAGNRSAKVPATITTLACADSQPPTKPAPVTVMDATPSAVTVSWPTATDNVGVDHYNVYRGAAAVAETTSTSTTVTGLSCGTSYTIGVNAEDGAGNASDMASTVAQTDPCAPAGDTQSPSAPGALAAISASRTSIGVTWAPATDNVGVTGYTVYRDGAAAGTSTATSYTVSDLSCGVTYRVAVDAFDAAGNHSARTEAFLSTAACADTTPPLAPASVNMGSRTQTSISVTWPAATDNIGVVGYGVYRAGTKLAEVAERAYTFAGLTCGANYTLGVDAYDAAGNRSAVTTVIIATTACADTTAPTAPTNLSAGSVTTTGLTLSWSAASDNVGVTKYEVSRNATLVASPTTTSSTQTGLTCGTSYSFAVLAVDAAGNRSTPAQLSTSTTACTPTGPAPTLQPIDGGTGYFGRFVNTSGMDALSYFPIAVWGSYNHTQANRDLDAAAGLNTYVWAADNSYVDDIRSDGRFKVIQDEGNRANVGSETAGWLLGDEIDMCCGPPGFAGGNGYDMLSSTLASLPQDNRLRYANYGKGVLLWESDADAARFINGRTGPNSFQQVVSSDLYWFTDPNENGNSRKGFGSSYGDDVTRMRFLDAMDGARMPVWAFVETGWPFTESASQGGRSIQPAEIRSAVWHALIAGARGIIYFEHSFGGPCLGDHHTIRSNCEGTRPMVTSVDAQVKSLAAVLNSPSVSSGHSVTDTMTGNVRDMVKWDGSNFYVFAGADKGGGNATFSMPCVGNATATVLGESRTVAVSGGSFTDSFADKNAVHIYRIDGGSRCGL